MTRKDNDKDAERPHYYSQFWLDIAAGRRVIGGPKPDEADAGDLDIPETISPARKNVRSALVDGFKESRPAPVAASVVEDELPDVEYAAAQPEDSVDELEVPNIDLEEEEVSEAEDPLDEEFAEEDGDEEEEDLYEAEDGEEEEEEEEDDDWGRRGGGGRKKPKPSRPVVPAKKPKRSPRRSF